MECTRPGFLLIAAATLAGCAARGPDAATETARAAAVAGGCNRAALQQVVVQRVNEARLAGPACNGETHQAPVRPLQWNAALGAAASRQADDMARRDYLNLRGPDGTRFEDRVREAGYGGAVGPVLAAGDYSPEGVVRSWLAAPAQCATLTNPAFSDIGAACASRSGTSWGHYWAVVVGGGRDATKASGAARADAAKAAPKKGKKAPKKPPRGCKPTASRPCR